MANNVIGQFRDEIEQTADEVARDIKDSVGEMIEQGIQSAKGSPLTPQQLQQKQQEDQKKEVDRQKQLAYTRGWLKNLEAAQYKARMENKQKEQQRLQAQQQEVQQKKVEAVQKTQAAKKPGGTVKDVIARSQAELKVGKGLGG